MSEMQDFKSLLNSIDQKLHAQTAPTVSVAPAKIDSGEYAAVIVLGQGDVEPTREDALWAMDQAREGDMLALAEDANLLTLCLCGKTVGKIIEDVKNQSGKALDGLPAAILYFGSQSLAEAFPESRRQATPQGELSPPFTVTARALGRAGRRPRMRRFLCEAADRLKGLPVGCPERNVHRQTDQAFPRYSPVRVSTLMV